MRCGWSHFEQDQQSGQTLRGFKRALIAVALTFHDLDPRSLQNSSSIVDFGPKSERRCDFNDGPPGGYGPFPRITWRRKL